MTTENLTLSPDLTTALEAMVSAPGTGPVLVASDFDGVLAPLVDDPLQSRITSPTAEVLRKLGSLGAQKVVVALLSGRDLETLDSLTAQDLPFEKILIGSHGAEWSKSPLFETGEKDFPGVLDATQSELRQRLGSDLETLAAKYDGAWIEHKPFGVALHTRLTPDSQAADALTEATEYAQKIRLKPLLGKNIFELSVLSATKGSALVKLAELLDVKSLIFLGDDITDETAFRVITPPNVSLKVGAGETAAQFKIPDLNFVAPVFTHLEDTLKS